MTGIPRAACISILLLLAVGEGRAEILPADFEKILLPIAGTGATPGAYGSLWMNDFWIFNDATTPAVFADTTNCQLGPSLCIEAWGVPANAQSSGDFLALNQDPPGLLLYVAKRSSAAATFNLRVQDVSRQAETWGTELPVVRESEFRSGRIELLNIPLDDRFRQTLRIYDPDAHEHARFRIALYDTTAVAQGLERSPGTLVAEMIVEAQTGKTYRPGFPRVPSVAQLANFRDLLPNLPSSARLRIEIEPVTSGMRFWAFVSVTNNETQHVTLVTPN
jgi:hypothetical protein